MALPVQIILHDDEVPIDFVVRLAVANGFPSLRSFLAHTEITEGDLVRGDAEALAVASHWTGIPDYTLGRLASGTVGPGQTWRLGSAMLSKDMRPGRTMRFCPSCVLSDRERATGRLVSRAYRRAWWNVRSIQGCPDHACSLSTVALDADADIHDFPHFVSHNIALIEDAQINQTRSPTPCLDIYLRDRVLEPAKDGFLDTLEAHVAAEFSRYLGDFLKLHNEAETGDRHDVDLREQGFAIAVRGEAAVKQAIANVIDRKRPSTQYVEAVVGPMLLWLRRNASNGSYALVIDLVQDVLERNMPFGIGQTILRLVRDRHLYCVNSAHADFGLRKERIRLRMVSNDPEFRDGVLDGSTYFNANALRPILQAAAETVSTKEAAVYLGTSEERVHDLLEANLLEQVEKRSDDIRAYTRIPRTAVKDLALKLVSQATLMTSDDDLRSLANAARFCRRPFHALVAMILDGGLVASLLPGDGPVLQRLRLSKRVLVAKVSSPAESDHELVRLKDAELALGTASVTVSDLINRGYLRQTTVRLDTGRTVKFVERASLDAFLKAYASLSMIAKSRSGYRALIKVELEAAGIAPIFEPDGFVARFYRRSEPARAGYGL